MSLSRADDARASWPQQVGAARLVWSKLSEDELLKSEGQLQKLAGLIQQRYAISRYAAEKQAHSFIAICKG